MRELATQAKSGAGGVVSPCASRMESEHSRSPLSPANRLSLLSGRSGGVKAQASSTSPANRLSALERRSGGYNTRASKKKQSLDSTQNSSPDQRESGETESASQSTPLMTMTTRSRANMRFTDSSAPGSGDLSAPGSSDQRGPRRSGSASMLPRMSDQDTSMRDLATDESTGKQGAASGSASARQKDHRAGAAAQSSSTRRQEGARNARNNPVLRLTTQLLDTYQGINEKYYAKHKKLHNNGHDDDHGDYIIVPGDMVNGRYEITRRPNGTSPLLGKGSFGQVVYALDRKSKPNKEVAVKIIKNHRHWHEQAKSEIDLLKRFTQMQPVPNSGDWVDYANVVRLIDDFVFHSHCCLVFELLPFTLYDLLKISRFRGVSLVLVSRFAQNLMRTLDCLRHPDVDVIHCDLKPENVMLVKNDDHRVKVIDFGSSCSSKHQPFTYIQSRFYRSPEVLLCRPYGHAIDMWSLGCILVEMHTGQPLFNGKNEQEQMRKIVEVLGMPPKHMIAGAGAKSKVKDLFVWEESQYVLAPEKPAADSKKRRDAGPRDFKAIIRKPTPSPMTPEQEHDYELFEDLLRKMLEFDPNRRIHPRDALGHAFLTTGSDKMEMSPRPETPLATPRADKVDQAVQTQKMK